MIAADDGHYVPVASGLTITFDSNAGLTTISKLTWVYDSERVMMTKNKQQ